MDLADVADEGDIGVVDGDGEIDLVFFRGCGGLFAGGFVFFRLCGLHISDFPAEGENRENYCRQSGTNHFF
jgi:hypothetical protein